MSCSGKIKHMYRSKVKILSSVVLLSLVFIAFAIATASRDSSAAGPGSGNSYSDSAFTNTPSVTIEGGSLEDNPVESFTQVLSLDVKRLGAIGVARLNLLCAQGLGGAEDLDIAKELAVLDTWTAAVRSETQRGIYKYHADPAAFNHSEGYFRMLMLITVLQQDFGVSYHPQRINEPDFTDSRDIFLHGLTNASASTPHAGGTCVSMPVVYVAVARSLGYPVYLVTTKEHVFARWDGPKERFNIEATNQGLSVYPDEYYLTFPSELSQTEIDSGAYLRSLSPSEELAVFLVARGYVLEDTGREEEAILAYAAAHMLDPRSIDHFDQLGRAVMRQLPNYPALGTRNSPDSTD
jgi:hypothetical protein